MKWPHVLFALAFITAQAHSQDTTRSLRWELSGSLSYSYNAFETTGPGISSEQKTKLHVLWITPAVGYVGLPQVEPLLQVTYAYARCKTSPVIEFLPGPGTVVASERTETFQNVGLGIGVAHNSRLNETVTLYGGIKVALAWWYTASEGDFEVSSSHWSKPQVAFPIFFAGSKIFVSQSWALITQFEYAHQTAILGMEDASGDDFIFSGGFAVYL